MAAATIPYAKYLAGREALEVLSATPARLKELVDTLGPARLNESYAPGKWTLNIVLCHLADCELAFSYRWRQVVAQPHHAVQTFDQDAWAANYRALDPQVALAAFCANRLWSVNWLKSLTADQLAKTLSHPELGELTLHQILQVTAGHDLNHLGQFEQVVAAQAGDRV
jgi:hypothetical protein